MWGWTALKWQTLGTVWFIFPPKPLSEKWGYGKNCPEELVNAEHQEDLVWVCVAKRIFDLSARSWAEEEEKQSRLFQQTGIQFGGRGSQSVRQLRGKR